MHSVSLTLAKRLSLPSYKAGCNAGPVTNATQHNTTQTHTQTRLRRGFFFFYICSKRAGKGRGGRKWHSKVYTKVLVWESQWIVGKLAANKIANQPATRSQVSTSNMAGRSVSLKPQTKSVLHMTVEVGTKTTYNIGWDFPNKGCEWAFHILW